MQTFKTELERLRFEKIQARQDWLSEEQIRFYWQAVAIDMKNPKSASGFEKLIIEFLKLSGHQAEKIAVSGRFIDNSRSEVTSTGFRQTIGSKKYIPSTSTKGSADISSTIYGVAVKWEVKFSSTDKQSEHQKIYQQAIENSKGFYFIIKTLDQFYEIYQELLQHPKIILMKNY